MTFEIGLSSGKYLVIDFHGTAFDLIKAVSTTKGFIALDECKFLVTTGGWVYERVTHVKVDSIVYIRPL